MKKLILLLLFKNFVSCSQKNGRQKIRLIFYEVLYNKLLEVNSEKTGNKAINQQARCYCIFALEKTIELYPVYFFKRI